MLHAKADHQYKYYFSKFGSFVFINFQIKWKKSYREKLDGIK